MTVSGRRPGRANDPGLVADDSRLHSLPGTAGSLEGRRESCHPAAASGKARARACFRPGRASRAFWLLIATIAKSGPGPVMEMPIGAFSRIVFRVCSLASAARARWEISLAAAASCELGVAPLGGVAKHDHGSLDRPASLDDRSRAVFDGELRGHREPAARYGWQVR
jgi:hypothetical protein